MTEDAQRAAVLEAAAALFNQHGFATVTLEALAEAAELSPGEFQALFEDTHEVLVGLTELIRREAEELFMITMPDDVGFIDKLRLLAVHQAEWGNRRSNALSFFGRIEPATPRGRQHLNLDAQYLEGTVGFFVRHDASEALNLKVSAEVAAHVFCAMQIGFFDLWISQGGKSSFLDQTELVLDLFLHGVCGAHAH